MTLRTALKLSTLLALCLTAALAWAADETGKVARIVVLHSASATAVDALLPRLRMLRSADGKSYIVETRSAQGRPDLLPEMAAELVKSQVDVIVAYTNVPAFAAKNATRSIPIVVWFAHDAVGTGMAHTLARPGGNITGTESLAPELDAKRIMQLITQMVPELKHVAVLYNPDDQGSLIHLKWAQSAGQTLGFRTSQIEVRRGDFEGVLCDAASKRPDALLVLTDEFTIPRWKYVDEFAQKNRVPTVCEFSVLVNAGCLISYGPTFAESLDQVTRQVDRILKGAKPGDLPFEQPTRFELVVNRKTAAALGITIPQSILLQATRVVD